MLKGKKLPGSIWGGCIILIRMLGGLGMQKYMAIFFGPAGTTLLSHFQNFISLFSQPVQDAIAQGLISAYPNTKFSKGKLITAAFLITAFIFLLTICILFFVGGFPDDILQFSVSSWPTIIFSIFLISLQGVLSALVIAQQKLRFLGLFNIAQWLTIFIALLLTDLQLTETLLLFAALQGFFTLVLVALLYKTIRNSLPLSLNSDRAVISHFKQFILMALTVWISSKWVDFFTREYAIELFGIIDTGLWQSVARFSEAYRSLFISFLLITFYPTISHFYQTNRMQLTSFFRNRLKMLIGLSLAFFSFLFIFKRGIIVLLYSNEYLEALPLLDWQILGDLLAFISFPFALLLMATVSTGKYITCELISAVIFVGCVLMGSFVGVEILVYAHIVRFVFYLCLVIFFTQKYWSLA